MVGVQRGRKFASDVVEVPLKALCELGGWESPQTMLICSQDPDRDQLQAPRMRGGSASVNA